MYNNMCSLLEKFVPFSEKEGSMESNDLFEGNAGELTGVMVCSQK